MTPVRCCLHKRLIFIVCALIQRTSGAKRSIFIEWTRIECLERDPAFFADSGCWLIRLSQARTRMNVFFVPAQDINNMNGTYRIAIERTGKYVDYIKVELDFCDALGQMQQNYFLNMLGTEIRTVSNFPLKCPLKKNVRYEVKNFTLKSIMLPSYIPALSWATFADFWSSGKHGAEFNCFGKIKRKLGK